MAKRNTEGVSIEQKGYDSDTNLMFEGGPIRKICSSVAKAFREIVDEFEPKNGTEKGKGIGGRGVQSMSVHTGLSGIDQFYPPHFSTAIKQIEIPKVEQITMFSEVEQLMTRLSRSTNVENAQKLVIEAYRILVPEYLKRNQEYIPKLESMVKSSLSWKELAMQIKLADDNELLTNAKDIGSVMRDVNSLKTYLSPIFP